MKYRSGLSLKPSEEYANKLLRQLEECSLDGISCEFCTNETKCRQLYDMMPIFMDENDYQRYSMGFAGLRMTKEARDNPNSYRWKYNCRLMRI